MAIEIVKIVDGKFFRASQQANSVEEVFQQPLRLLETIPVKERINLYYSVADVVPKTKRHEGVQYYVPFDIDVVPREQAEDVIQCVCDVLAVEYGDVLSMHSGNGVQILVKLKTPIDAESYKNGFFDAHRPGYKAICNEISKHLTERKIDFKEVDTSVFKATQIMRFPETINEKKNFPTSKSYVINKDSTAIEFDWFMYGEVAEAAKEGGVPYGSESPYKDPEYLAKFPKVDTAAVLGGCAEIKDFETQEGRIPEPRWRAMASIFTRLENGRELFHRYSKGHPSYTKAEAEGYLDRALEHGPHTCGAISGNGGKCEECPNKGKVKSPINLKAIPEELDTGLVGFRHLNKDGSWGGVNAPKVARHIIDNNVIVGAVFEKDVKFWLYKDNHYKKWQEPTVVAHINSLITPPPKTHELRECYGILKAQGEIQRNGDNFPNYNKQEGILNFENGVVDVVKKAIIKKPAHKFDFTHVLPFAFKPDAKSPVFDKFLDEIMCGDEELKQLLLEFMGYCLMCGRVRWHKALLLVGEGNNGKSTLLKVIRNFFNSDNVSALNLKTIEDARQLVNLRHSFVNLSSESPEQMMSSEIFKSIIAGDEVPYYELYLGGGMLKTRAKFIFAANDLPRIKDTSAGIWRRFIMVPFNYSIPDELLDLDIDEKLRAETPGIFNKCIEAFEVLNKRGKFIEPKKSATLLGEFAFENNPVKQWGTEFRLRKYVAEKNTIEYEKREYDFKAIYKNYKEWCVENGKKPKASNHFSKEIKRQYPFIETIKKHRGRYWTNCLMDIEAENSFKSF